MEITKRISGQIKKRIIMSKQTVTNWLEEEFIKLESTIGVHAVMYELLERAKEMEKQQKATYWQEGYDACEFHNDYENLQIKPINNPYK